MFWQISRRRINLVFKRYSIIFLQRTWLPYNLHYIWRFNRNCIKRKTKEKPFKPVCLLFIVAIVFLKIDITWKVPFKNSICVHSWSLTETSENLRVLTIPIKSSPPPRACYWLHKVGGWYGILIRYTRRKHDTEFSIRLVVFVSSYCIQIIYRYIINV